MSRSTYLSAWAALWLLTGCTADDAVESPDAGQQRNPDGGSHAVPDASHVDDASAADASAHDDAGEGEDSGAPVDSGPLVDASENGCVEQAIQWTSSGGLVAFRKSLHVEPCRGYRAERHASDGTSEELCYNALPVDHGITAEDIQELVAHPDVQAAIAEAPVVYGEDSRFVDVPLVLIDIGGAEIFVGRSCQSPCREIPPGVDALATIAEPLARQQEREMPTCTFFE